MVGDLVSTRGFAPPRHSLACWDQAIYLDVALACSVALVVATQRWCPFKLQRLDQFPFGSKVGLFDCALTFANGNYRTLRAKSRHSGGHGLHNTVLVGGLVLQKENLQAVGDCWLQGYTKLKSVALLNLTEQATIGFMRAHL